MKIERLPNDGTSVTTFAPAVVLVFELESSEPLISFTTDPVSLGRIIAGTKPEWRDLLLRALDDTEGGSDA